MGIREDQEPVELPAHAGSDRTPEMDETSPRPTSGVCGMCNGSEDGEFRCYHQ